MSRPWITVVIPTYNGALFLKDALQSIVDQQDEGVEVIAVDDGSDDHTLKILNEYSAVLRLTILSREHAGNWSANTNLGMVGGKGEWACILHQDDTWDKNRLQTLRKWIQRHSDVGLIVGPCRYIGEKGTRVGLWRCPLAPRDPPYEPDEVWQRLLVQNFISAPSPIFRRELFLKAGGMREDLWFTVDWDLWLKLSSLTKTLSIPEVLCSFRLHPHSQTMTGGAKPKALKVEYEAVLEDYLERLSPDFRQRCLVKDVARFSALMNHTLAAAYYRADPPWRQLFSDLLKLGPRGWKYYLDSSCIVGRTMARIRAL